jgi:hypothetical protein
VQRDLNVKTVGVYPELTHPGDVLRTSPGLDW